MSKLDELVKSAEYLVNANKTAYVDLATLRMAHGILELARSMECPLAKYCIRHNYQHGAEAEELRHGIENLIEHAEEVKFQSASSLFYELNMVPVKDLQSLIDQVDARDSLAFVEVKQKEESDE